jgi:cyclophilin family peptidyl-prolyl cis-trans isomerase
MTATKSQRKRSRPVQKKSPLEPKGVKLGIILIVLVVVIIAAYFLLLGNGEEPQGNPIAIIATTEGTIKVELYEDLVPITVENFIDLANEGFYDGLVFHRIGDGFMIQGGAYDTDKTPHSSDQIEFESHPDVKHVDGAISMASTGAGVGGSNQFFICDGAQSALDDNYAAFGITIEGIDVVRSIASAELDPEQIGQDGTGPPLVDIIINSITIE